jgi:hypothetical protein
MHPYVLHHKSKYHSKRRPDATRTSFTMTAARCLYTSCVHDCNLSHHSTLLWTLLEAPSTPQRVPWCAPCVRRSIHWDRSWRHQERDQCAFCRYTTFPSSSIAIYRWDEFQSHPCCHTCNPLLYNYFWASPLPIHPINCWEHLCLSISTALN